MRKEGTNEHISWRRNREYSILRGENVNRIKKRKKKYRSWNPDLFSGCVNATAVAYYFVTIGPRTSNSCKSLLRTMDVKSYYAMNCVKEEKKKTVGKWKRVRREKTESVCVSCVVCRVCTWKGCVYYECWLSMLLLQVRDYIVLNIIVKKCRKRAYSVAIWPLCCSILRFHTKLLRTVVWYVVLFLSVSVSFLFPPL